MTTALAVQTIVGAYVAEGAATQLSTVTWTAADTTGNTVAMPGQKVLLLFRNSGASSRTVTIASSADPYGRKADISAVSIAAGAIYAKVLEPRGWEQTLGGRDLLVTANHAEVLIAAIAL